MADNRIYYIRKNHTGALPTNILFLDVETKAQPLDTDVELHRMYMGWTWHVFLGPGGEIKREAWNFHTTGETVYKIVKAKVQPKKPLYLIGSNVTFDLFASGLAEYFQDRHWIAQMIYDKGLITLIILKRRDHTVKILALQNFLNGSVKEWGGLLGLEKIEVNLATDDFDTIKDYCHRDVEITGRTFLSYLSFLRSNDMGGFSPTLAGQAFRAYRHRFMNQQILHYDVPSFNLFIRQGYYGGRTECGYIGEAPPGQYTKLDINSMYPALMREEVYPTRIRQWVKKPTLERIRHRLEDHCITAQCVIQSAEPVYAIRRYGKLCFPTGTFRATLSTGSLRYALEKGHIQTVEQAAIFYSANLFKSFVDHFYKLRQRFKRDDNPVWEKTAKLILNALYGKFGEKRSEELINVEDDRGLFFREPWKNADTGDSGIQWSAFGRFVREGGDREGPQSAPCIAAHVTDYGRIMLYKYMALVGLENVYYCDTDSLIIPTECVPLLKSVMHPTRLGALKVEGETDHLVIRGCKDYIFGTETRIKGIKSEHYENTDGSFTQTAFPGLYSLISAGITEHFPITLQCNELTHVYDKGVVQATGHVLPYPLTLEEAS